MNLSSGFRCRTRGHFFCFFVAKYVRFYSCPLLPRPNETGTPRWEAAGKVTTFYFPTLLFSDPVNIIFFRSCLNKFFWKKSYCVHVIYVYMYVFRVQKGSDEWWRHWLVCFLRSDPDTDPGPVQIGPDPLMAIVTVHLSTVSFRQFYVK